MLQEDICIMFHHLHAWDILAVFHFTVYTIYNTQQKQQHLKLTNNVII